jgi:hypothetical protein
MGETETAKRGPRVGDRERERWRGLVGRKGGLGWAAAQQGKEESGPKHKLDILQIKDLSFELRFEIEFEFVSLLKFKLHTFELQINQRKTNSHILPYFKHMFYKWDNLVKKRASNLVQKLIALTSKQKVLNFRKIYTPKFLGCYTSPVRFGPQLLR